MPKAKGKTLSQVRLEYNCPECKTVRFKMAGTYTGSDLIVCYDCGHMFAIKWESVTTIKTGEIDWIRRKDAG